jgi:hypothetical protein
MAVLMGPVVNADQEPNAAWAEAALDLCII